MYFYYKFNVCNLFSVTFDLVCYAVCICTENVLSQFCTQQFCIYIAVICFLVHSTKHTIGAISVLQMPMSLAEAMTKSMEDMTHRTYSKFKQRSSTPTSHSLFLFVSSIARTNLEVELVQRGNSLVTFDSGSDFASASSSASNSAPVQLAPKRSCIGETCFILIHFRFLQLFQYCNLTELLSVLGYAVVNIL